MAAEQVVPEALCSISAPSAGLVFKKSRKSGKWKPVFLLARLNLWWIDTKGGTTCPEDIRAWRKANGIELVRSKTTVDYTPGECQWTVRNQEECQEFKVNSQKLAASWVAALQRRVSPWADVLMNQGERMESTLQVVREAGELSGPLRAALLESTKELVGMLGASAELLKELGSTPIAGPILSLLGLALETVHRERADAENLQLAKSELHDITKRIVKGIKKATKKGFDEYKAELLDLLSSIEQIAKQLERYELSSTIVRIWSSVCNLRRGPTAILQMIQETRNHLLSSAIYHTGEMAETAAEMAEAAAEGENGKG